MEVADISHLSHPNPDGKHNLKLGYSAVPFRCDGCNEAGIGVAYTCVNPACNFDLHTHCGLYTESIKHPFHTECDFKFRRPKPGKETRSCNACEKPVTGFRYHCKHCRIVLHPCCAKLPMAIVGRDVKLNLKNHESSTCDKCGRKGGRSWCYRSSCKKYNLHVACAKEILDREIYGAERINNLRSTLETHVCHSKGKRTWKWKGKGYSDVVGMVLQIVVSAVLGDPTALIAGIVTQLIPFLFRNKTIGS